MRAFEHGIEMMRALLLRVALIVLLASPCGASVIYVDDDAALGGDGLTWDTAFIYLQDALTVAQTEDDVRVAQGIYKPDRDEAGNVTLADREATFQLVNGVAIYGGYAGLGAADPNERDVPLYETVLSGDLAGDDGAEWVNRGDNSLHVVTGSGTDNTAILDGFGIRSGYANGDGHPSSKGGGIVNLAGSPTVSMCTFTSNGAGWGGAMANYSMSSPVVVNCTFTGNQSFSLPSHGGGAIVNDNSAPVITACQFSSNSAENGGAILNFSASPTITTCAFSGNTALNEGGAIANNASTSTLLSCTFTGNVAGDEGGGIGNRISSNTTLANCVFSGNEAEYGGGMSAFNGSTLILVGCTFTRNVAPNGQALAFNSDGASIPSNLTMTNGILWGGGGEIWNNDTSTITIAFSDVQGGWSGEGNINSDPLFIDADGADGIPGTADDDLHLLKGSPCVNAGTNDALNLSALEFEGEPRIQQCRVDMGADESPYFAADCNTNDVADACDIGDETSPDLNENGVPDECDPDCQPNSIPDFLEITLGLVEDCNNNEVPDECDIADGISEDCNENGGPDKCDIATGASEDCTGNGIPDECEPDCNTNGVPDSCDIDDDTSPDFNDNGIPDECEPDCQPNAIPDFLEILLGLSEDCDGNEIPDECEPDFDGDGLIDDCDPDVDGDGVPNELDLCSYTAPGVPVNQDGRPMGDWNKNCVVDLEDFKVFAICADSSGPGIPPLFQECRDVFDFDDDDDVDLVDFAQLQVSFGRGTSP